MAIKVGITTVIDDSRNIINVGNFGDSNTVYYGDGSNLTGVSGDGGDSEIGVNEFVAIGTIPNGAAVSLNTDGTVGVVTTSAFSKIGVGTAVTFDSSVGGTLELSAIYDSTNGKVVIAYKDAGNSSYGTAIVGTVSGTSISFGSPVVFQSSSTTDISSTYDSTNQKVVISYQGPSDRGTAIVGTVSGTSISFGTAATFETGQTDNTSIAYDSSNQKVVIAYTDTDADNGKAVVGTVSGTSISFGSPVTFESDDIVYPSVTFDSHVNKVVIAYQESIGTFTKPGKAVVGTVSGDTISFGLTYTFHSGGTAYISTVYDSLNEKVVILYQDDENSGHATAIVVTVGSDSSLSFGSDVVVEASNNKYISSVFDSDANKIIIVFRGKVGSDWVATVVGTVSGTSISFDSTEVIEQNGCTGTAIIYDSTNKKAVAAYTTDASTNGKSVVLTTPIQIGTLLTSENYIGIAAEAISDGATGKITTLSGINTGQTGLTIGRTYYVQNNGSVGLSTGSPPVIAGTSISSTKMIVS